MTLAHSPLHSPANLGLVRNDWTRAEVRALFALPFPELMFEAARLWMGRRPAAVGQAIATAANR